MTKKTNTRTTTKRSAANIARDREDARDVAIIRREIAKGGRSYSLNEIAKENGLHDLVVPTLRRR